MGHRFPFAAKGLIENMSTQCIAFHLQQHVRYFVSMNFHAHCFHPYRSVGSRPSESIRCNSKPKRNSEHHLSRDQAWSSAKGKRTMEPYSSPPGGADFQTNLKSRTVASAVRSTQCRSSAPRNLHGDYYRSTHSYGGGKSADSTALFSDGAPASRGHQCASAVRVE